MKKQLCAAVLALWAAVGFTNDVLACGDKFLTSSLGTRYKKAAVKRPPNAAILIWANPSSELPKGLASVPVDETLRKVGYRPTTVSTADEFDKALARGGWDLVLVGAADAAGVSKRIQGNVPAVVPVALNPTESQMKQVRTQYSVVVRAPAKSQSFLDAVDEALTQRTRKAV
jgi:hypothetical protein